MSTERTGADTLAALRRNSAGWLLPTLRDVDTIETSRRSLAMPGAAGALARALHPMAGEARDHGDRRVRPACVAAG